MVQDTNEIGVALAKVLLDSIKNPHKEKTVVEFDAKLFKGRTVAKI